MTDKRRRLSDVEIIEGLKSLPGWSLIEGKLHCEYQFRDFVEAWGFMTMAALHIHEMDHHPEWFNVYHRVRVDLMTHSLDGVSPLDMELAGRLNEVAARVAPRRT